MNKPPQRSLFLVNCQPLVDIMNIAVPIQPWDSGKAHCGKEPKMKKLLIKSTIAAFAIEIIGAVVNLISYAVNGHFLLAKQLVGGEWMGWSGFGMLLNRTYPMSSQDHPVSDSTWISFDPGSLVLTLLGGFVISFIVFGIIRLASKK